MSTGQRPARTTNELISQMPEGGTVVVATLKRLGLWTSVAHDQIAERRPFAQNLANLESDELADEQAYWTSEAGRISELLGALTTMKVRTDLRLKQAQASSRTLVRNEAKNEKTADGKERKLTAGEVSDLAEGKQVLKDAREDAALVESTIASVAATREATLLYLNTLSREITRRGDLAKARI